LTSLGIYKLNVGVLIFLRYEFETC
jgi:hypothetical protein